MSTPLRIGMLCHSTNPRGGVAHALALSEALTDLGHQVTVHAPDPDGRGFPRHARCGLVSVAAQPLRAPGLAAMVEQRMGEYADHFRANGTAQWDVLHAHDGIGTNALLQLRREGLPVRVVRTVHHLDEFGDPRVDAWQNASVVAADGLACVSAHWQQILQQRFDRQSTMVGNGVDLQRYGPTPAANEQEIRQLYQVDEQRPLVLSIGGVEARKNTVRLLEAFLRLRKRHPQARLLIVGGASLLDHSPAQAAFAQMLALAGLSLSSGGPVTLTGAVPDAHIAPLLRAADVFAFPSLREGFGLVTLEALACGTPLVTSNIAPFTEYLNHSHCRMAQPDSAISISKALEAALDPWVSATLRPSGFALARQMRWSACALRQEALYHEVLQQQPVSPDHTDPPLLEALPDHA